MKLAAGLVAIVLAMIAGGTATAQTKSEQCAAYAHDMAATTPTTTGVARGAVRGAVVGSFGANAGRGAAVGAAVGGTRRAVQRNRSYQYYYDRCMAAG
jgi:hypothetical protein